ncbi:TAXI family TRAP transporter solute-binding subunit [Evansella sp. LMS18]|uniref:TAXI family TRAP transporter solute-binding subunit n=1 Tax=Evansella sp. LMS18 TaxID=2924033 RepID=UPI0020D0F5F5|nr:TAXI family TRAP transporter solute-binding subunit [Evansella sp. LMS18]UTR12062.1 TAXI family TRAP transporter solute-binding subunit [Evansella sp. LMS18]
MKKEQLVIGLITLFMVLVLAACGSTETDNSQAQTETVEAEEVIGSDLTINWASGPQGGITYPFAVAATQMLEKAVPGISTNVGEGAATSNALNVNDNEAQMAHTQSDVMFAGINGVEPFNEELTDVMTFGRVLDFHFQIAVDSSLGVTAIEEIAENEVPIRLIAGERGTSGEIATQRVLEAYGISYDDIESWGGSVQFLPYAEGAQQIQNRHADAMSLSSAAPTPVFQEIQLGRDLTFLPISDEVAETMAEQYGYVQGEIPAESYNAQDNAVQTITSPMQLIVHKDIPEEVVYEMLQEMFTEESLQNLGAVSEGLGQITPEYSGTGLVGPLHPGAEKFYQEHGVID